jgi:CheY-like chemotaxis protein
LGQGSTFTLHVQAQVTQAQDVPTARPARRVIQLESGQPTYHLLVVDDMAVNRKLLVKLLSPLGFVMHEAANGLEAIAMWEKYKPQLIWMDIRMPTMDGYEATRRIKATAQGETTTIIALTASVLEEERKTILYEGCDAFVRKPFREDEIFDTLAQHLGVRFVYAPIQAETLQGQGQAESANRTRNTLTADALASLPAGWGAKMHQATTRADVGTMLALIDQIRAQDATLAQALNNLTHNFNYEAILTWLAGAPLTGAPPGEPEPPPARE